MQRKTYTTKKEFDEKRDGNLVRKTLMTKGFETERRSKSGVVLKEGEWDQHKEESDWKEEFVQTGGSC